MVIGRCHEAKIEFREIQPAPEYSTAAVPPRQDRLRSRIGREERARAPQPSLLEEAIQRASREGATGASTLQSKIDQNGFTILHNCDVSKPRPAPRPNRSTPNASSYT